MNDKTPKEIMNILKAVPCEEEELDLPFKMPKNVDVFFVGTVIEKNFKDNRERL